MSNEYVFKIIIIGSASVGKTSLVYNFIHGKFSNKLMQTTGVEYSSKTVFYGDKQVKLQLWDTAGQERFRSITKTYYRGAKGVVLVFDLTSRGSFMKCKDWLTLAKETCGESFGCVLVGNKKDLENERKVTNEEILDFCEANEIVFIETSCLTGENVRKVFDSLNLSIFKKIENNLINKEDVERKWMNNSTILNDDKMSFNESNSSRCGC